MKEQKFCCDDMADYWGNIVDTEEGSVGIVQNFHFMPINFCPWCAAKVDTDKTDKKFVVVEKANTIKCCNCEDLMFSKYPEPESESESEICVSCQQEIAYKKNWSAKYNAIQERVTGAIKATKASENNKVFVIYNAYKGDSEKMPIDNLDEIAVEGKVRFASSRGVYPTRCATRLEK